MPRASRVSVSSSLSPEANPAFVQERRLWAEGLSFHLLKLYVENASLHLKNGGIPALLKLLLSDDLTYRVNAKFTEHLMAEQIYLASYTQLLAYAEQIHGIHFAFREKIDTLTKYFQSCAHSRTRVAKAGVLIYLKEFVAGLSHFTLTITHQNRVFFEAMIHGLRAEMIAIIKELQQKIRANLEENFFDFMLAEAETTTTRLQAKLQSRFDEARQACVEIVTQTEQERMGKQADAVDGASIDAHLASHTMNATERADQQAQVSAAVASVNREIWLDMSPLRQETVFVTQRILEFYQLQLPYLQRARHIACECGYKTARKEYTQPYQMDFYEETEYLKQMAVAYFAELKIYRKNSLGQFNPAHFMEYRYHIQSILSEVYSYMLKGLKISIPQAYTFLIGGSEKTKREMLLSLRAYGRYWREEFKQRALGAYRVYCEELWDTTAFRETHGEYAALLKQMYGQWTEWLQNRHALFESFALGIDIKRRAAAALEQETYLNFLLHAPFSVSLPEPPALTSTMLPSSATTSAPVKEIGTESYALLPSFKEVKAADSLRALFLVAAKQVAEGKVSKGQFVAWQQEVLDKQAKLKPPFVHQLFEWMDTYFGLKTAANENWHRCRHSLLILQASSDIEAQSAFLQAVLDLADHYFSQSKLSERDYECFKTSVVQYQETFRQFDFIQILLDLAACRFKEATMAPPLSQPDWEALALSVTEETAPSEALSNLFQLAHFVFAEELIMPSHLYVLTALPAKPAAEHRGAYIFLRGGKRAKLYYCETDEFEYIEISDKGIANIAHLVDITASNALPLTPAQVRDLILANGGRCARERKIYYAWVEQVQTLRKNVFPQAELVAHVVRDAQKQMELARDTQAKRLDWEREACGIGEVFSHGPCIKQLAALAERYLAQEPLTETDVMICKTEIIALCDEYEQSDVCTDLLILAARHSPRREESFAAEYAAWKELVDRLETFDNTSVQLKELKILASGESEESALAKKRKRRMGYFSTNRDMNVKDLQRLSIAVMALQPEIKKFQTLTAQRLLLEARRGWLWLLNGGSCPQLDANKVLSHSGEKLSSLIVATQDPVLISALILHLATTALTDMEVYEQLQPVLEQQALTNFVMLKRWSVFKMVHAQYLEKTQIPENGSPLLEGVRLDMNILRIKEALGYLCAARSMPVGVPLETSSPFAQAVQAWVSTLQPYFLPEQRVHPDIARIKWFANHHFSSQLPPPTRDSLSIVLFIENNQIGYAVSHWTDDTGFTRGTINPAEQAREVENGSGSFGPCYRALQADVTKDVKARSTISEFKPPVLDYLYKRNQLEVFWATLIQRCDEVRELLKKVREVRIQGLHQMDDAPLKVLLGDISMAIERLLRLLDSRKLANKSGGRHLQKCLKELKVLMRRYDEEPDFARHANSVLVLAATSVIRQSATEKMLLAFEAAQKQRRRDDEERREKRRQEEEEKDKKYKEGDQKIAEVARMKAESEQIRSEGEQLKSEGEQKIAEAKKIRSEGEQMTKTAEFRDLLTEKKTIELTMREYGMTNRAVPFKLLRKRDQLIEILAAKQQVLEDNGWWPIPMMQTFVCDEEDENDLAGPSGTAGASAHDGRSSPSGVFAAADATEAAGSSAPLTREAPTAPAHTV